MSDPKEYEPDPSPESGEGPPTPSGERSVWRSPSVMVAALVMLAGLGFWVFGSLGNGREIEDSPGDMGAASLLDSHGYGEAATETDGPGVTPAAPVAFRLGAGYLGGFFLGWAFRRFIRLTLLISGGLVAILALFQGLGWFEVNWSTVGNHLQMSLAWVQGEAGSFKAFLVGYLPSAGAATAGMVVGFRR